MKVKKVAKKQSPNHLSRVKLIVLLLATLASVVVGFWLIVKFVGNTNLDEIDTDEKVEYSATKLAKQFPQDFPLYPGAKVTSSWTAGDSDALGVSAVFETPAAFNQVKDFYVKSISEKGWSVTNEIEKPDSYIASFNKGSYEGFIGITKTNVVTISVTISQEK